MPPEPRRRGVGQQLRHDPIANGDGGSRRRVDDDPPSEQVRTARATVLEAAFQHLKSIAQEEDPEVIKHESPGLYADQERVVAVRHQVQSVQARVRTILTVMPPMVAALPLTASERRLILDWRPEVSEVPARLWREPHKVHDACVRLVDALARVPLSNHEVDEAERSSTQLRCRLIVAAKRLVELLSSSIARVRIYSFMGKCCYDLKQERGIDLSHLLRPTRPRTDDASPAILAVWPELPDAMKQDRILKGLSLTYKGSEKKDEAAKVSAWMNGPPQEHDSLAFASPDAQVQHSLGVSPSAASHMTPRKQRMYMMG